ncbi:MAG: OmpA family protein [Bdellovibrionales bacterium]
MFKNFALIAALVLAASVAQAHNHRQQQDVVYDQRGDVVRSAITGDCVYAQNQMTDKTKPCSYVRALGLAERTVYFAFNSSKLGMDAKAKLDSLAAFLKANAEAIGSASVVGYADRIGNTAYNKALSKKRANAVTKYLKSKGVLKARTADVRALGEADSQTDCEGDKASKQLISCLAPDRRVEVEIEYIR